MKRRERRFGHVRVMAAAVAVALAAMSAPAVQAGTTWDGGAFTSNWSNALNWSPDGVPVNGNALSFGGFAPGGNSTNDLLASVSGITFLNTAGGAFLIGGNALGITGSIVNNSSFTQGVNNNLTLGAAGLTLDTVTANLNIGGNLSGTGTLTKQGFGTATLFGDNTYTGPTTISAGTLRLGGGATGNNIGDTSAVSIAAFATLETGFLIETIGSLAGAGNVSLVSGGLQAGGNNTSTTFSGSISGSGSFGKSGTGTLTLSGTNNYSGSTLVLAGTLALSGIDRLSQGTAVNVSQNAALALGGFNQKVGSIEGGGNITLGSATLTTTGLSGGPPLTSKTFSGVISGSGGLTKEGNYTLILSGINTNTYTGATTISAGTLQLGAANKIANTSAVTIANGGTFNLNNFSETVGSIAGSGRIQLGSATLTTGGTTSTEFSGVIAGSGGLTKSGSGSLTLSGTNAYTGATTITAGTIAVDTDANLGNGGALVFNGGVLFLNSGDMSTSRATTLNAGGGTFSINDGITLTHSGFISGTGGLTLTGGPSGGTLILSGTNSYTGSTTIQAGTVKAGAANKLATGSAVVLSGGARLDITAGNQTIGLLAGVGEVILGSSTLTAGGNNFGSLFSGFLSGTGGLTKVGTGIMQMSGTNTYTGTTDVSAGTLALSGSNILSAQAAMSVAAGATLTTNGIQEVRGLSGSGSVVLTTAGDGGRLAVRGGQATTFSGVISGTGTVWVQGSGTSLTLNNVNSYSGGTVLACTQYPVCGSAAIGSGPTLVLGTAGALSGSTRVELSDGSTLNLSNFNQTVGSIGGMGSNSRILLGSATLTAGGNNSSTSYSGVISGTGSLVKTGGGTLFLDGANTHSGGTTISGGTLAVLSDGALGTGVGVNVAINAFLDYQIDSGSSTSNRQISGAGSLAKSGTGILILSGANTYTGATNISSGTLRLGAADRIADASGVNVASGATFDLNNSNETVGSISGTGSILLGSATLSAGGDNITTAFSGVIHGTGALVKAGSATLILSGANDYSGGTTVAAGTLQGSATSLQGNITNNAAVTFDQTGSGTYAGVVSGSGTLSKTGTGTLVISGANTYTGATTISAGILRLGAADRIADASALTVSSGATFSLNNFSETVSSIAGGGSITLGTGTLTAGGNNTSTTWSGNISGTGGLTKTGTGMLILSTNNSYTGPTTVNAGIISINSDARLGAASADLILNGGTLQATQSFTIGSGRAVTLEAPGGGTFDVTGAATLTMGTTIAGAGGLTKTGTGTLLLDGATTYTGATAVNAGTLSFGIPNIAASGSAFTVASGAVMSLGGQSQTVGSIAGAGAITVGAATLTAGGNNTSTEFSGDISGTGGLTKVGSGTLTLTGSSGYSGATTISAGTLKLGPTAGISSATAVTVASGATFDLAGSAENIGSIAGAGTVALNGGNLGAGFNNASGTFSGLMSGAPVTSAGSFNKEGTGTLTLTGSLTYTGATTINGGELRLGAANRISDASALTVANGGTFNLNGNAETVGSIAGAGSITLGSATLTVGGDNTTTTFSGVLSGSGGDLTKTGTGMLTLTGTNTYTGVTTISGGILSISSNANLGGVNANLTLDGGTLRVDADVNLSAGRAITLGPGGGTFRIVGAATTLSLNSGISGTGDLTKTSTGTLFLDQPSTYTGATNVDGGTLTFGSANVMSTTSSVTVASGATMALANHSQVVGSIAGAGSITLGSATLTAGGNNTDTTFSGVISGTGALVKAGTGTLIVTGANSYTGGTTVSGGVLQGTTTNLLGNITNNATVAFNQANTGTYAGVMSGTGNLTKLGGGTLVLTGNNSYSGATTIDSGVLALGASNRIANGSAVTVAGGATFNVNGFAETVGSIAGAGNVQLGNNGTLSFGNSGTAIFSGAIGGTGTTVLNKVGAGIAILSGVNTQTGVVNVTGGLLSVGADNSLGHSTTALTLDGGGLQTTASFTLGSARAVTLGSADGTFDVAGTTTLTINQAIGGTLENLVKEGTGTLVVGGNNTYDGSTNVNAGILRLGASSRIPNDSRVNVASTATFDLNGFNEIVDSINGSGRIRLGSGSLTVNGASNSSSTTFSGIISGSGSLEKAGVGTLTLSGANDYTGGTSVSGGTLSGNATSLQRNIAIGNSGTVIFNQANAGTYAGNISGDGSLTKAGAGVLTLTGADTHTGATTVDNGTIKLGAAGAMSSVSALTLSGSNSSTLDLNDFSQTLKSIAGTSGQNRILLGSGTLTVGDQTSTEFSGSIQGTGGLTKNGTGTLTLKGNNTYSGDTIVNAGSLILFGGGDLNSATNVTVNSSGTFGTTANGSETIRSLSGTGRVVIGGGSSGASPSITVNGAGVTDSTFSGQISGDGALRVQGGMLTLNGEATHTGGTEIGTGGTLRLGASSVLLSNSTVNLIGNAKLDLNGHTQTLSKLLGTGEVTLGAGRLSLITSDAAEVLGAGISGTGGFTKSGSGSLGIVGSLTYTGTTIVAQGELRLLVANRIANTSALTVQDSGTFSLGNFNETVGSIAGAGSINLGNATLTAGGNNTDTTFSGAIIGDGDLTKTGTGTLILSGPNTYSGTTTVSGGVLSIGADANLGAATAGLALNGGTLRATGNVSIANTRAVTLGTADGTFEVTDANTLALNAAVGGSGRLTKQGTGTLELGSANTYSGGTRVNGGTLSTTAAGALGSGSVTVAATSTLALGAANQTVAGLTNSGNTTLGGATLTAAVTNSAGGALSGFGTVAGTVTNSGAITASGGALTITGGIQAASGTVTVNPGATLDLSASATGGQAAMLNQNGSLVLAGGSTFRVEQDYTNANFGTGNSFNKNAGVSGGSVTATGNTAQAVTGTAVTSGTTAAPTLALGNIHVGQQVTANYEVANTGSTGPALRGAIQTTMGGGNLTDGRLSGTGVTAGNFGPIATGTSSGNFAVTFNGTTAGALTSQAVHLANNFANVGEQTLAITGAAYNLAQATVAPVNFGNRHVGDAASQALSISNTAPAGAFTEKLNASIGGATGNANASGSFNLLAAGGTNNTGLLVGLDTSTAGARSGTATITLASDGTGTSGLGLTDLPSQVVNVSGNVYRYAQANTVAGVNFGNVRVGDVVDRALTISNVAAADGFSEKLDAKFGTVSDARITTSGQVNLLAAGQTSNSGMKVGLNTSAAGNVNGTATLLFTSNGLGTSDLGTTALADQVIAVQGTISGAVFRVAQPSQATPNPVTLANQRVGGTLTQTLTISNNAANDGFSEKLNASISGNAPGVVTASGSFNLLGPTQTNNTSLVVGVNTATAGAKSGTATINLVSDGTGTSGLGQLTLDPQTVNVSGNVYRLAEGSAATPVNLGNARVGGTLAGALSVSNTAANDGFSEKLNAQFTGPTTGGLGATGTVGLLAAGATNNTGLQVGFSTATAGARSGTTTVAFQSDGAGTSGFSAIDAGQQQVTVTGAVYRLAEGSATPGSVILANQRVGGAAAQALTISNNAASDGYSEKLNAGVTGTTGGATGGGTVSLLAAGSSSTAIGVGVNTATAGSKSGTVTLGYASDGAGTSGFAALGLGSQTIAVEGDVYRLASGAATPSPVLLANQRVGGTLTHALTISNTATDDGYSEKLNAKVTGTSGAANTSGGPISLIAAGSSSTAIGVGVNTLTAGAKSGTVTLGYESDGTGTSGFAALGIGSQTINVSGNVYRLAEAALVTPSPVVLANQREGGTLTQALTIKNNATADGYSEKLNAVAGTTGGATAGGTVGGLAAGASSNAISVGVNTLTAGAKSGTVTLGFESDGAGTSGFVALGIGSQTVNVSGDVYRLAVAGPVTPSPVVLANQREGGTLIQALTIKNNAASDGYSEKLNAVAGTTGGATAGGTVSGLAAGASSNAISVGVNTLTAGAKSGTVTLGFESDGAGTSGFAALGIGSQTVNVSGNVYRLAQAGVSPDPVAFGSVRLNTAATQALTISNNAVNDGFSEKLNAAVTGTTGATSASGGPINQLGAGTSSSAISLSLDTSSVGVKAGTATLTLASDGAGTSGLALESLGTKQLDVTGTVYRMAQGSAAPSPIVLGNQRVGGTLTQALTISNNAANDGFSEKLNAGVGGTTGHGTAGGSGVSLLAAGASTGLGIAVGVDTSAAGLRTGSVTVAFQSDGAGTSGLAAIDAGSQTINVSGSVYRLASADLAAQTLNFGAARVGDAAVARSVTVNNTAVADGYSEGLKVTAGAPGGGYVAPAGIDNLAAGASTSATVTLNTATAGNFSGHTLALNLASTGAGTSGLADEALGSVDLTLNGKVYAKAAPTVVPGSVNFGILHRGDIASQGLTIGNAATGALTDILTGGFGAVSGPFTGTGTLGAGVAAGESSVNALKIGLNTGQVGSFSGTASLALLSHNEEMADLALGVSDLTVLGQVNDYADAEFEVDSGNALLKGGGVRYVLDFGTLLEGSSTAHVMLEMLNAVHTDGSVQYTDLLGGFFSLGSGPFEFSDLNWTPLAGGAGFSFSASLDPATAGRFTEELVLHSLSINDLGQSVLLDITLVFQANVLANGAQVPVPGGLLLMLPALGALWLARRRGTHVKSGARTG